MRRAPFLLLGLLALLLPPVPSAALPPEAPKPTARPATPPRKPPLDFTGVWELDAAASRGYPSNMRGAVLSVAQTGHRILIEPVGDGRAVLTADQIVVDGRTYEKTVGPKAKGYVTATWSPDRASLRLEVKAGPTENPRASVQRSIWTLSKDRKVWVRQSMTSVDGKTTATRLVFRRRAKK